MPRISEEQLTTIFNNPKAEVSGLGAWDLGFRVSGLGAWDLGFKVLGGVWCFLEFLSRKGARLWASCWVLIRLSCSLFFLSVLRVTPGLSSLEMLLYLHPESHRCKTVDSTKA